MTIIIKTSRTCESFRLDSECYPRRHIRVTRDIYRHCVWVIDNVRGEGCYSFPTAGQLFTQRRKQLTSVSIDTGEETCLVKWRFCYIIISAAPSQKLLLCRFHRGLKTGVRHASWYGYWGCWKSRDILILEWQWKEQRKTSRIKRGLSCAISLKDTIFKTRMY